MQVKQEQINPCLVELEIQVDSDKVAQAIEKTYKEAGKYAQISGFRKGKAPRALLEKVLDKEKVKESVVDNVLQDAYREALAETKIEPYAQADVSMVSFNMDNLEEPFIAKARVPLAPKVELGEYKGLNFERQILTVTDEQVQHELDDILERGATMTQIFERAATTGDIILVDMTDTSEENAEPKRQVLKIGDNLPDMDAALVGINIDDEKEIVVSYPEDHQEESLRGKTITWKVKLHEIHERILPELNDEWVKARFAKEPEEGQEADPDPVDTADKLKFKIREAMEKAAQDVSESGLHNSMIKTIVENATVHYPEIIAEEAVKGRFQSLAAELKNRSVTLDDYLKYKQTTFEELFEQFKGEESSNIEASLVLQELIEKENLRVEDAEVDAKLEEMAAERKVPKETIQAYLDKTQGQSNLRNEILQKKVMDFLIQSSNIKNTDKQ